MSIDHPDRSSSDPLFFIIIPLEFHRGHWSGAGKAGTPDRREIALRYFGRPPDFREHILLTSFLQIAWNFRLVRTT